MGRNFGIGPDLLVVMVGYVFAVASFVHGKYNSRRPVEGTYRNMLQLFYVVALAIFSGCVLWVGRDVAETTWVEAGVAALIVSSVHVMRAYFERSVDPASLNRLTTARHAMDGAGNLTTILFGLFAAAERNMILAGAATVLGALMVLKELKFRIVDDVDNLELPRFPHGQSNLEREIYKRKLRRKDFFANYIKSYFYIVLGYAIVFRCVLLFDSSAAKVLYSNGSGGAYPGWDSLWFSIGSLVLNSKADNSLTLQMIMGSEFLIALTLATHILSSVYRHASENDVSSRL